MQTVILAAGLGTRLRPLTEKMPKPMVLVKGKPFLEYQIELLKKNNLDSLVLCLGYLGEQIEDYFKNGKKWGLSIKYSKENDPLNPLGTGGTLKKAEGLLEKEFLVLYGDSFLDIDYQKLLSYFHSKKRLGAAVVYSNNPKMVQNNIEVNQDNEVVGYNKKEEKNANYVEAGVLAFNKKVLGQIPQNGYFSIEEDLFPLLIKEKELAAFVTDKKFYDIGTFERLKIFSQTI